MITTILVVFAAILALLVALKVAWFVIKLVWSVVKGVLTMPLFAVLLIGALVAIPCGLLM
ncbi:MAG: hypothetical protein ACI4PQ_03145 [Butyricicoccaceae bacterium]